MEMAVIYGAITLHRDYVRSTEFIKSLGKGLISTSDFGLREYNDYHYNGILMYHYDWDDMIISYANTTGASILDDPYLGHFILDMEYILRNIDFVQAIIHMQSVESSQNKHLFWEKREHRYFTTPEDLRNQHLVETDEWNFGYGRRSLTGYLKDGAANEAIYSLKHNPYPPRFSEDSTTSFFNRVELLIQDNAIKEIQLTAFDGDRSLSKLDLLNIINYLSLKKIVAPIYKDDLLIAIQLIRPELLKIDCLYS